MIRTTRTLLCFATAFVALAAGLAQGEVNVAVGNGDKISGTLLPASEIESYRVLVPEGAVFKLKAKGKAAAKGQPKPPLTLKLFDPDGLEVGQAFAKVKPTVAQLKGYAAERTGEYRIEVAGDGATSGDYLLSVKWTSPKRFTFDLEDTGTEAPSRVGVPLDAGATITIKLKASKGSAATPVAEKLEGDSEYQRVLPAPAPGASAHTVKKEVVPVFGEATLQASGGGRYAATVTVKPPKLTKRKIDLTQKAIGSDAVNGGDFALGQVIGAGGGSIAVGIGDNDVIGGAGVVVPAGALASPTAVLVGTSSPMPTQTAGDQPAGPTVFFGPEGLQFQSNVSVTIPFDAEAFGGDLASLSLFTRDADGNVTEITEFEIDVEAGTCTFPASHFSSFRLYGPLLTPVEGDLDFDGKGDLVLRAPSNGGGHVYIVPGDAQAIGIGTTAAAPIVLTGEGSEGEFGEVVITGDLNGDGRDDLVVTAPAAGINGRVYVFLGASDLGSRSAADADVVFVGQAKHVGFGRRLAIGDVNGDFVADLVVGADAVTVLEGGGTRAESAGAAYVFFGSLEISSRSADDADVVLTGAAVGDGFGAAVAVGDVTNDGFADVIVSADQQVVRGTGQVYVFAGGPDLVSLKSQKADVTLVGNAPEDAFGLELDVGDVTGDGITDLVIAAAGDDDAGVGAGAVYVFSGGSNLGEQSGLVAKLTGESSNDDFGFNVVVRDLDGIAGAEVIVSADRASGSRGKVYVFAGGTGFTSQNASAAAAILTGEAGGDRLSVLQQPWDVSGDGLADLIMYAPGAASGNGRAYLYPGGAELPAAASVGAAPIVIEGQSLEALGGR